MAAAGSSARMHREAAGARIGYLGPQGTFSEEALLADLAADRGEPVALETIQDTVLSLRAGDVEWAIVPIENALDGSVTVTLDLLADLAGEIEVIGETILPVEQSLIVRPGMQLEEIETVLTHPQVPGQCRTFLRKSLPQAKVRSTSSTADAVRAASRAGRDEGLAAIGPTLAAEIYGGEVLQRSVQDRDDNVTRFVWLGRAAETSATAPPPAPPLRERVADAPRKTSLVFWGAGADRPGWLVLCLDEFARRGVNLTKIESRPTRERMGHYMFFVDLDGAIEQPQIAEAIHGLQTLCEEVRVLGSYATAPQS